jgi:hypothetical protein
METLAIRAVLAVIALVVSARTRLDAVILGRPVSVPVFGIVAVVLVLALVALILHITRTLVRDGGLRLRPRVVQL